MYHKNYFLAEYRPKEKKGFQVENMFDAIDQNS